MPLILSPCSGKRASIRSDDDMNRRFQHMYTMTAARLDTHVRCRRVRAAGLGLPPTEAVGDVDVGG